jgi:fatty-acyl-CoA synthase
MDKNKKTSEFKFSLKDAYIPSIKTEIIEETTIGEELQRASVDSHNLLALVQIKEDGSNGKTWTYSSLYDDCLSLAKVMARKHKKGTRVAIWSPNYPEWVIVEYAAALAGLVLVTVNPSFQADELKYVLEKSQSEELYVARSFRGNPMWEIAAKVVSNLPFVKKMTDIQDWDDLYEEQSKGSYPANTLIPLVYPRDAVQIQFTSGTTGFPKGAKLHHMGLLNNAKSFQVRMGLEKGDHWLNCMPMFHTSGAGMATLGCLAMRATHFIMERFDAKNWCSVVEREKINFLTAVPTMFVEVLDEWKSGDYGVSKIKGMTSGGTSVPPSLVKELHQVFGVWIQIVYGQTETSPVITLAWADDTMDNLTNSVGQPLPNIEVSIRNPKTNNLLEVGEVGEICSRGHNTMLEYHQNPEATKEAIDGNNWLHTGDLGVIDSEGYVRISGRVKEMIIRGGENIYPKEIENSLLEHESISEVAVVGIPDKKFGEIVGCFLKFEQNLSLNAQELKEFIREKISPQKTPAFWVQIEEWPLTGSGKIKKYDLREQFEKGLILPLQ